MQSDYIIYADESGDHGLDSIDQQYPVFVLSFCIFKKTIYNQEIIPMLQNLKFQFFEHDMIVLHSHEIRKARGPFKILVNRIIRQNFLEALNKLVENSLFTLISSVIDKRELKKQYVDPDNPYSIALGFCLERAKLFLNRKGQTDRLTYLILESRGKREDDELELVFRRLCQGENWRHETLPFEIIFASKKFNSTGLQIADLMGQPIGRHILEPNQSNRAYDIIERKFDRNNSGKIEGWGLKIFP